MSVHYGDQVAVRDLEFDIAPGEITAIIGPSGCGKTSFLHALNRLSDMVSGCRVTGTARLGELDITDSRTNTTELRRRIGMIFQKPVPFPMSVAKNLHLPLRENGVRRASDRDRIIEDCLRTVGLWDEIKDRFDHNAAQLSGGQQQRLCIARALSLNPEVLLLDEPCSALDPMSTGVVEECIRNLRGRCTQVIVTHNLAQARRLADTTAMFWVKDGAGCMIEHGPTEQLFTSPSDEITRAYVSGERG